MTGVQTCALPISVIIAGLTALMGSAFYYLFVVYLGPVSAAAIAATAVGFTGGLLARRFLIPPLIVAIAGITPMLPGLAIYRGMYATLNDQTLMGFTNIAVALATASSLAAGVVLGEWIARRLRRPPRFNPYRAFTKANEFSFQEEAEQNQRRQRKRPKTNQRFGNKR